MDNSIKDTRQKVLRVKGASTVICSCGFLVGLSLELMAKIVFMRKLTEDKAYSHFNAILFYEC